MSVTQSQVQVFLIQLSRETTALESYRRRFHGMSDEEQIRELEAIPYESVKSYLLGESTSQTDVVCRMAQERARRS